MGPDIQHDPSGLGYSANLPLRYEDAIARVKDELSKEGFGILSEIDITKKLKEKLGVDFRRYTILGACNPQLAYEALENDLSVGLLLPCNVVVYEQSDASVVSFIKPKEMLDTAGNPTLETVAEQADAKIRHAFERLRLSAPLQQPAKTRHKHVCTVCNFNYEEDRAAETKPNFHKLPDEWTCPSCGSAKSFFTRCDCATLSPSSSDAQQSNS